jgi:probable F420-dependent oxidoreductase
MTQVATSYADGVLAFADVLDPAALAAYAQRLEELGYASVWLPDVMGREIFVSAGYLLAHTSRIRVATGIAHVYGRDAVTTAQAARSLAELYGGRFELGLGVSHPQAAEAHGETWLPPVRKLRSYLADVAAAEFLAPPPPARIRTFIAAHGPKLLALAAKSCDGANTYLMPLEHTREARSILGPEKELNVVLPCCLCEDEKHARRIARRSTAIYRELPAYQTLWARLGFAADDVADGGSDRLVDTLVAWGSEAAIRERIAAIREAGASRVIALPYNPEQKGGVPHWPLLEALAPQPN